MQLAHHLHSRDHRVVPLTELPYAGTHAPAVSPMNTPAHAVLNLVLLGATKDARRAPPVLVGAVLPDLPIVVLYAYERLRGMPEAWIWRTAYYDPRYFGNVVAPAEAVGVVAACALIARR